MEQLNLNVTLNSNGSFTLTWSSISDASKYSILVYQRGQTYTIVNEGSYYGTSYTTPADLAANEKYRISVVAHRPSGGNISEGKDILIPYDFYKNTPLSVPQNVNATADAVSVTVRFDKVIRATSYDILFDNVTYSVTGTSRTFTGLSPKTSHTYSVRAKDATKTSAYSVSKTIRTLALMPAVPSALQKTVTDNSVTISWGKVNIATSYDLKFNGSIYNLTSTSKTFSYLVSNTSYTYQVRAKNADGASEYTSAATVTTAPKAPTSVNAESTANTVKISWNAVTGAKNYYVKFNGVDTMVAGTSCTFQNLISDTDYTYQVCSIGVDGSGSYSTQKIIRTKWVAPAAPGNVEKTSTENSVTVSWKAVTGATGYDVLFNGTVYGVTTTSKTFTGLSANTSYTYQVRTKNAKGVGEYSAPQTVRTTPKAPSNANVTANENSITLSWSAVTGATSYDVLFNGKVYNVTGTSKTFTGLSSNASYTYQVRVNNADGSSTYSPSKTIKTAPSVPVSPSASATKNSVTIKWNAVTGATSYDVLFNGTTYRVTGTSKTISGLTAGKSYSYAVRANSAGGSSSYSTAKTISTLPNPPAVPTNVKATSTTNSVTVSWTAVSGATGYEIVFGGTTYSVTGTSRTFTGLLSNTSYTYRVCAKNAGGKGSYSSSASIRTLVAKPTVPGNISATSTYYSVTISWGAVSGATGYDVLFNGTVYSVTSCYKTISGLSANRNYSYQVRARNSAGTSAYSASKSIATKVQPPATPTGVSATATLNSVTVKWNAVSGATGYTVLFNGTAYNVTGTTKTFTGLSSGVTYDYAVRASNAGGTSSYCAVRSIRTPRAVPATPTNVRAVAALNDVTVIWDAVENADNYDVNFDGTIYPVSGISEAMYGARSQNAANTMMTLSGLKPGTEHSFCVRASNESGSSAYSPIGKIKTKISKQSGLPDCTFQKTYPDGKRPYMGLDPVNALTGSFLWSYTCLEDYGRDSLHFTAMYDSQRDEYPKVLGSKWTYALNYLLYMDDEYAYFSTPYDKVISFHKVTGTDGFQATEEGGAGYHMGMTEDQMYFVKAVDGTEYIFDSNLCLNKIIEGGLVSYRFENNNEGRIVKIIGRRGASLTITYSNGHISSVSDAVGNAAAFEYEDNFLSRITNPDGKSIAFTYDSAGRLLKIADCMGNNYLVNGYDIFGRVVKQTISGRGDSHVAYDTVERTTTFTDETGNETKYCYDENGHMTGIEQDGRGIKQSYNADGRLTEQTDRMGNVTRMAYDAFGRMNQVTYPDGSKELISYNERNYPVRIVNRDGAESLYEYDARNNLTSVQDERGNLCTYTYDESDNLITYTDKEGHVWSYTYDANNHLEQAQDPEGNIYKYSHDAIGRLVSYISPSGKTVTRHYSATGQLLSLTDDDGTLAYDYNNNGSNISVTDRRGNSRRLEYDGIGQPVLATDFMGNEYRFDYDQKGNLAKETDPLGYSRSYTYDASGNCIACTDHNGNTSEYSFDAARQLTEVKDAAGNLTQYAYDPMGRVTTVTDALKNQTSYTYDAMGRLLSVTDAMGYSVSYTYDHAGNLLTKTDENGATISYTYNKENRLTSIESDAGTILFTYDSLGRVTTVQDEDGNLEDTVYDGDGNVTEFSDKEGGKTTYVYDSAGHLSERTDPRGGKTAYAYDENGNCIKITDAEGFEHLYKYDANNRLTKETNPLGYETVYEYNGRGELKSVTDARGGKTAYEYDGNGNLIKEENPAGGVAVYTYDSLGRLTESLDAENNKRSYAYDANGNMTSYTDANENQWLYAYDAVNRLVSVTDKNGNSLEMAYTGTGKLASVKDREDAETSYEYDKLGRLVKIQDALENSLSFTYDSQGRVLSQTDGKGNITEYTYSPSGNLLSVKAPEGGIVTYTYDGAGQVLTETDALGNTKTYEYDALGQPISVTDAAGEKISFAYTADGKIASVTDACGNITSYQYDACGNLTRITDPEGNTTAYEYDAMNNQISECLDASDGQQCVTIYQYDKKGRVIKEINPVSDEKSYTYDANGNITAITDEDGNEALIRYDLNNNPIAMNYSDGKEATFRYNKRGELVELQDWNGIATMEYDAVGRLLKVTDHNSRTTGYGYDAAGNRTSITYPDGSVVNYAYDRNNRITKVTDGGGKETQYSYDAMGNVISLTQPGGNSKYTYNVKGLPSKVSCQFEDGTAMENSFSYDAAGKITGMVQSGNMPGLPAEAAYTYDKVGRLMSYRKGQDTESYTYDAMGNRLTKKLNDIQTASYQYDGLNRLTGRSENGEQYNYGYDKRGNLTEEKRGDSLFRQYIYDAAGRMQTGKNLESGGQTEYGYNALNMRVKYKQVPESSMLPSGREISVVSDFLSHTNNELMAFGGEYGEVSTVYGKGYTRLSQKTTPYPAGGVQSEEPSAGTAASVSKAYFQPDIMGSPLFAASEAGNVLRYAPRDIWGGLEQPVQGDMPELEAAFGFTSYHYDPVIEKHFAQARFYDGTVGRMVSPDPVKRGLNGYPYCGNDPVDYVDPTGEIAHIAVAGILGGITGGVFGFVGSAASQLLSGEKVDLKRAAGSAVNGMVTGAVRGALIGSGTPAGIALAADFLAGTVGSALEQKIGTGDASLGRSITGGLANAAGGAVYGNAPLKNAGQAFRRGGLSGAAISGLDYLSGSLEAQKARKDALSCMTQGGASSYARQSDPKGLCNVPGPFATGVGYPVARGYQYDVIQSDEAAGNGGFNLADFGKQLALGFVLGGMSSAAFYGAGKAVSAVRDSVRSAGKSGSTIAPTQEQMHDAITEWAKMEESLANSKRQLDKFNTATVVYDVPTGNYYYGMNRGVQLSGENLNNSLASWLPVQSLNQYRVGNCAEVDAVNQALNNGADIKNLYLYTINTKNQTSKAMCENCVYTFADKVAQVLSH